MKIAVASLYVVLILTTEGLSQKVLPCDFNSRCVCKYEADLQDITCVGVPLARLPDLPTSFITHMDIVSSGLEVLENESFGSMQVENLRLISNKIAVVGDRVFSAMPSVMKSLDLSYNELQEIPFRALKNLRNLDWVNFHGNHIISLETGDWSHMRGTLTNIFMGENDLTSLPRITNQDVLFTYSSQSLAEFKVLTWINLDSNKIFEIQEGMLPSRTLQTLSISHNYLSTFPFEILEEMPALNWLYLRGNYIENIPDYNFRYKETLDKLDLAENEIKEVPKSVFNGSITIKDLHLGSNFIKYLPGQVFRGLNLGRLHLPFNRLRSMDDKALVGAGPYLEFLDLEGNLLDRIPKALRQLKRLRYLYLANNNLSAVDDEDFESFASVLKALSLAGNTIETIPWSALKDCVKLSHLNIGYNQIARINESDFESFGESLHTLILRNNRLNELSASVFRKAPNLKELSLSFNKFNYLHPEAFNGLTSLESLEMSFSLFGEDFPGEVLKPLRNLVWLSLDNNHIRTFPANSLYGFSNLQYLNLESNRIEQLSPTILHKSVHKSLRDVRLSYNHLTQLVEGTFSELPQLQTLLLNGNRIETIHTLSFVNLPNLMALSITHNSIQHIAPRAFSNLPNLIKLELQHNSLKTFSMNFFENATNPDVPLFLNLSYNVIETFQPSLITTSDFFVKTLDLSHNRIVEIPQRIFDQFQSLRNLNLGYNLISKMERNFFGLNLRFLEYLNLQHNHITRLERRVFYNLENLQIIILSNNKIDQLQTDQFRSLENLRFLDLSYNKIRSFSKEIFQKTKLESLKIDHNELVVVPSNALGEVGYTLRHIDLSHNFIEHLDGTTFRETPYLNSLNLSNNRLTILPDNVFVGIENLITLDLSHNLLRSNFKELFHFLLKLRWLSLAGTALTEVPNLPLPNLVHLDLSGNYVQKVYVNAIEQLNKLRTLLLSANRISHVPSQIWVYMPLLKTLDISRNPVKTITKDSFHGLINLQHLDVSHMSGLERFDSDSLIKCRILSTLNIQTLPKVEKYRFRLGSVLANVPSLRSLRVHVQETKLTDQLLGAFNPKLKLLEITGERLETIEQEAFEGAEVIRELTLRITGTALQDLKPGVLSRFQNTQHLSVDLSGNRLRSLAPSSLYANGTSYLNIATKMMSGGLLLRDNPWSCDCGLVWLGHWLRRWLRETVQIHTVVLEVASQMQELIREAKCLDASTGQLMSIADLFPETLSCHASALSRGRSMRIHPQYFVACILLMLLWWTS